MNLKYAALTLFCTALAWDAVASPVTPTGTLRQVSLMQLHPTQAVIGKDQIFYKLERFAREPRQLFDEICETNGQGQASEVSEAAELRRPDSFQCEEAVGTHPGSMKTAIVGPGGQLYLTDGHHTLTTLWEQPGGGPELKIWLRITDDFSASADVASFWKRMEAQHKVWLRDGQGQPIQPSQLPEHLGLKDLQDDPYRSLAYFTRGAAYGKPSGIVAPEFLEFYWGRWLRSQLDLSRYDLGRLDRYQEAVEVASQRMVSLSPQTKVGDSGFTAQQLGGFERLKRKALDKTFSTRLPLVIDYKTAH